MVLHEYTISALGHLAGHHERETSGLGRSAVDGAGLLLDRNGNRFEAKVSIKGFGNLQLRWKSDDYSCALATFVAEGEVLSASSILSGLRPEADQKVQMAAHAMIEEFCRSAGETCADGLSRAGKRPMVACIRWSTKERKGMSEVHELEMCLAAAFLERAFDNVKWLML